MRRFRGVGDPAISLRRVLRLAFDTQLERKYMPNKLLEGCQWGSAVPRTVLAPLTGPQVNALGIYFRREKLLNRLFWDRIRP